MVDEGTQTGIPSKLPRASEDEAKANPYGHRRTFLGREVGRKTPESIHRRIHTQWRTHIYIYIYIVHVYIYIYAYNIVFPYIQYIHYIYISMYIERGYIYIVIYATLPQGPQHPL